MKRLYYLALLALPASAAAVRAGETGHFTPSVPSIRDYAVPEPGLYGVLYNIFYTTSRLNDNSGDKIRSLTIQPGPGPGATLDAEVNLDMYILAPAVIWVSPWKLLGAKYGAYITPSFANSSVGASLSTVTGSGRSAEESQFNVGDLYVHPFWLGWTNPHADFALGYGFYAPVGKYDTDTVTLAGVPITAEAPDNIGLGFWTHQIQGAASWYPWEDKRMAVAGALTYEIHHEKEDFDITPGQSLTLNWGVSQYLPLREDQQLLLEVGPAGYSSWQVSDDSGSDARNADVRDQVHAAGGQVGLTYIPWNAVLNFHYFYEIYSEDRFQGQAVGLNLAVKI